MENQLEEADKMTALSFKLSSELYEAFSSIAKKNDRSLAKETIRAVKEYIENHKDIN